MEEKGEKRGLIRQSRLAAVASLKGRFIKGRERDVKGKEMADSLRKAFVQ